MCAFVILLVFFKQKNQINKTNEHNSLHQPFCYELEKLNL